MEQDRGGRMSKDSYIKLIIYLLITIAMGLFIASIIQDELDNQKKVKELCSEVDGEVFGVNGNGCFVDGKIKKLLRLNNGQWVLAE